MPSDVTGAVSDSQLARMHALLATIKDISASLHRMSTQLEPEVGAVVRRLSEAPPGERSRATSALAALELENAQLKQALEGRAVIEQAKGMLMARHDLGADGAFDVLVALSRREQRKVREVAADLVAKVGARGPARGSADEGAAPTGAEASTGGAARATARTVTLPEARRQSDPAEPRPAAGR